MGWIETWMNDPKVKAAVGADSSIKFASCNLQVNQAFLMQGDGMHNSAPLLTDLVNDGIRLLIYAGNADYMCNFIVSQRVSSRLVCRALLIVLRRETRPGSRNSRASSKRSSSSLTLFPGQP